MSSGTAAEPFWLDPALIRFKIAPVNDLHGTKDGDWDLARRFPLSDTAKHRAIVGRLRDGLPWEETELFRDLYRRRFEEGGAVRGATTLEELAAQYYSRVDQLAASMKRDGFLTQDERGKPVPLPALYMGRGGEVFLGNQGNHRLAIAQAIGLSRFAGKIVCRHRRA